MYFVRTSSPKPIQEGLKNTRTLKEMLDIIENSMTKKESVYNSSAELTNTKWSRSIAEQYLTKVADLCLRINKPKPLDDGFFISKII